MYLCHTIENKRLPLSYIHLSLFFSSHSLQSCHVRPSPTTRLLCHDTYVQLSCYMVVKIFFLIKFVTYTCYCHEHVFFFKVTTHLTLLVHVKTNLRSHQLMLMTAHHMEKTEI